MLRNVSENLLGQINTVTNRFENQGHTILRSANALESANHKIDKALQVRTTELNQTLDRMSGKADELGRVVAGYSTTLEGSVSDAQQRARLITQELTRDAQQHSRATLEDLQKFKQEASRETDRAMTELRSEFSSVSREVTERLGSLTSQFSQTSDEVRQQAARAATQLEDEQKRLKRQLDLLPAASQETSAAMRKALRDQLRALDQLSALASRTAGANEFARPRDAVPLQSRPVSAPQNTGGGSDARGRSLTSLTSTLAREMSNRPQAPAPDGGGHDRWSLGDLLARASSDDPAGSGPAPARQPPPRSREPEPQ